MTIFMMANHDYQLVYDCLSFSLACMMSCTCFLWIRIPSIVERYKSAVLISGLVTFIAAYHYIRIFNSWVDAYEYPRAVINTRIGETGDLVGTHVPYAPDGDRMEPHEPVLTGTPFNDAYRYMDWLLTVPLLLIEIILVMKLPPEESNSKCWTLGTLSALMILSGYKGELVLNGDMGPRWVSFFISLSFFLFIVQQLLGGLAEATNAEPDPKVAGLIKSAQVWTCVSWCTYPIVYTFPMMGISGPSAVCAIQVGYTISDIISKCGVGLLIYQITYAKSKNEKGEAAGDLRGAMTRAGNAGLDVSDYVA